MARPQCGTPLVPSCNLPRSSPACPPPTEDGPHALQRPHPQCFLAARFLGTCGGVGSPCPFYKQPQKNSQQTRGAFTVVQLYATCGSPKAVNLPIIPFMHKLPTLLPHTCQRGGGTRLDSPEASCRYLVSSSVELLLKPPR